MIRNLIILDNAGRNLLAVNFGECHSLGGSSLLVSSFISAIYSFGQSALGEGVKNIKFENLIFLLMAKDDLIFLISADDDETENNRLKLDRISAMFLEKHAQEIQDFEKTSLTPDFTEFTNLLLDLKITQKNCGGKPECEGCPNHRVLPLDEIVKVFRKESGEKMMRR